MINLQLTQKLLPATSIFSKHLYRIPKNKEEYWLDRFKIVYVENIVLDVFFPCSWNGSMSRTIDFFLDFFFISRRLMFNQRISFILQKV